MHAVGLAGSVDDRTVSAEQVLSFESVGQYWLLTVRCERPTVLAW